MLSKAHDTNKQMDGNFWANKLLNTPPYGPTEDQKIQASLRVPRHVGYK